MSRIGKKPIKIPKGVSVTLENEEIIVKGKHGELKRSLSNILQFNLENDVFTIKTKDDSKKSRQFHGLYRCLINNMVNGVNQTFSKTLIAEGVGYKFQADGKKLIVNVGFSHPVEFLIPSDLSIKVESPTKISIIGIDKERVGFFASKIRKIRPPEPYKGKGLLYEGEKIIRKAGKTGK
jgi:large subunit ribosomal protein L6